MRFFCMADEDTVRGFRLGGVEGRVVSSRAEVLAALQAAAADRSCGVVLLTEEVAARVAPEVAAFRLQHAMPLIAIIPAREAAQQRVRSAADLAREAIGLRLDGALIHEKS